MKARDLLDKVRTTAFVGIPMPAENLTNQAAAPDGYVVAWERYVLVVKAEGEENEVTGLAEVLA